MRLPRLQWLDRREILPTDRLVEPLDPHPDELRSAYFNFTVFRIMSVPPPPKPEKVLYFLFFKVDIYSNLYFSAEFK